MSPADKALPTAEQNGKIEDGIEYSSRSLLFLVVFVCEQRNTVEEINNAVDGKIL